MRNWSLVLAFATLTLGVSACSDGIGPDDQAFRLVSVHPGAVHTCGLNHNGRVYCWSSASRTQRVVGLQDPRPRSSAPYLLPLLLS
jgi:hypothetical protein